MALHKRRNGGINHKSLDWDSLRCRFFQLSGHLAGTLLHLHCNQAEIDYAHAEEREEFLAEVRAGHRNPTLPAANCECIGTNFTRHILLRPSLAFASASKL
jgi:hypothetical protein